jgi:SAM-dependent methyltransferase
VTNNRLNAQLFGQIAIDYTRLRPGPPTAALDWLVGIDCETVVELGAGTGLATQQLAKIVTEVCAVEPDERMLQAFIVDSTCVTLRRGSAEDIPVADGSVDGVYAFDSWHWADPDRAVPEVARVLRPDGQFGVAWSRIDTTLPQWAEFWSVIEGAHPAERRPGQFTLPEGAPFAKPESYTLSWVRQMLPEDLVSLLCTYSRVLAMERTERAALLQRQREFLKQHMPLRDNGLTEVPYRTVCWRTRRSNAPAPRIVY